MADAWPPRSQLLCVGMLLAFLVLPMDALRLDLVAVSSDGSMAVGSPSRASVSLTPEVAALRAQRGRDLRAAADYIDSINVQDYHSLGDIRDILEHLDDIRERMTSFRAARDPRHRQIRNTLRDVAEQVDALKVIAGKLEAEGQVDDGGDELPTQRDNVCRRIRNYCVEPAFLELVQLFCQSLDTVRKAVNAREDEEPMAYSVSGLSSTMAIKPDYRQGDIGFEIQQLLGEERRWVAKHLAPPSAGTGSAPPSSEGTTIRFRRWALRAWKTQMWEDVGVDTAALPFRALKEAHEVLLNATVDDELTLSSVRTRMQRIEFCKTDLAQFISGSDSSFRVQVREVLHEMKVRMEALRELEVRKLAAGEVDHSGELLPSQRDNICRKLDACGLEEDFREDVRRICQNFDNLHNILETVKIELDINMGVFEVFGRIAAIRRRPGFADAPAAIELENLLAEEWSWLEQQGVFVGA